RSFPDARSRPPEWWLSFACSLDALPARGAYIVSASALNRPEQQKRPARGGPSEQSGKDQRLENWKERRALARPYFLRSTTRLSRVRNPPFLSTPRSSGSKLVSAVDRPWRTAPAWPERPPPATVHITSNWPVRLATTSGCWIIMRSTGRAK